MSSGYRARRIPVNVTDSGRCFNGLFRTRNVIEGLILAAGQHCWLVSSLIQQNSPSKFRF